MGAPADCLARSLRVVHVDGATRNFCYARSYRMLDRWQKRSTVQQAVLMSGYMPEIHLARTEQDRYLEAWRDRRLRFRVFKIVSTTAFLPFTLCLFVIEKVSGPTILAPASLAAYFVLYMVAGIWLNRFRCPRCGKLYYWDLRWRPYRDWRDCHHCGLKQDALPS